MSTELVPRRVAIIGCGYVGSALAQALAGAGHDVVATATTAGRAEEFDALGARLELLDIADVDRLCTILADRDTVYLTIAPKRRGQDYREIYLAGARNLIAASRETGVRRIIYTSSTRVYGQDDGSWVDEASPTEPKDEPARILLEAENALLDAGPRGLKPAAQKKAPILRRKGAREVGVDSLCVTVLRLSGIYGPGRDPTPRIEARAGTERADGGKYINLIHRDDVVAAMVALLETQHHGVLNLSDDQSEPRRLLYDRVIAEAGLDPIHWNDDTQRPSGKRVRNDLVKKTLDLRLRYPTH